MLSRHKILILILIFGAVLRLCFLGKIPAGFTPDEASQAYTAYSLLQTGKDEWGISFPLISFRSFLDYKAPLQTYLMIPSIAIFGLNEFAARLPSAIFGILAILAIYLLAKELFGHLSIGPLKLICNLKFEICHLSALLFAISPLSLQFSRTALEANLSSFLFPFGLYLFLRGLKTKKHLLLSGLIWGLNLYSYHAAKFFTPLFILGLLFFFRSRLKDFKYFVFVFAFFFLPIVLSTLIGSSGKRGQDLLISHLSTEEVSQISSAQYLSPLNQASPLITRIFQNKIFFIADKFVENLMSYYSPTFWFTEGGREITYSVIPGRGLLYLWQLPFLIFGLIFLFRQNNSSKKILLLWLLLAALPAAITKEGYRPNRAASFMGLWEIIISFGLIYSLGFFNKYLRKLFLVSLVLIASISFVFYLQDYALAAPIKYYDSLSFGYRDLMAKIIPLEKNYSTIIFDRGSESQAFVAFYKKLNPIEFQAASQDWLQRASQNNLLYLDMLDPYKLGQYEFRTVNNPADFLKPDILLIIPKFKYQEIYKSSVIDIIYYPNREPAYYLLSLKNAF